MSDHSDRSSTTYTNLQTASVDNDMAGSTSSVDSHRASVNVRGTPTTKHGRTPYNSAAVASQSWIDWMVDKYTIQYSIPPAYAPAALQVCITAFPLGVLFGLVLPRTFSFLLNSLTTPTSVGENTPWWTFPQLSIYLCSFVVFHMLEFVVTASYNPTRLFSDSFLLNNGIHYHLAHFVALVEFALTAYWCPSSKSPTLFTYLGIALVVLGQALRSMAMVHAHNNFSHVLAYQKRNDHELVTTGVYAWTRHPSYVGFSYWALGTQLVLGNKLSLVGFVVALWLFFSRRIRAEEKALVEFFGDKYVQYRRNVGTGLPFI